jgi:hypothetical protein
MKWMTRLRLRMHRPEVIRRVYRRSGIDYESDQFRRESGVRLYFRFAIARAEGRGRRK